MAYEALLDDLETLQKSYAAADEDDKKIQSYADDKGEEEDDEDEELDKDGKPVAKKQKAEPEGKENPFAKSFSGITADGEEFEAVDGTELIKSLNDKIEVLIAAGETEKSEKEDLTKSLGILADVVKTQGRLLKSLQESHLELSKQGRGRQSVMSPTLEMAKSLQTEQPLNAQTFMLKANAAFDSGRISGKDLVVCDVAMRHGSEIDPSIVTKIMAG
jgi:hypothetical protein